MSGHHTTRLQYDAEWGVMAIVWRGWHTGWTSAPGPDTTPGPQAYSYTTTSSCTTTITSPPPLVRCWCIQNASGASSPFPRNWWWAMYVKMVELVHWPGVRSVPQKILVAKAVNLIHSHPQHRMIDPAPSRSLWIQFCTKYPEYPIQGNAIDQGYRFIKDGN